MCKHRLVLKVRVMNSSKQGFAQRFAGKSGFRTIERRLLAALIAVTTIGAVRVTGTSLLALYDYWSTALIAAL